MEYFMNFQTDLEKAEVIILPIPHEETTSYGKGTKEGPKAILKASNELENYNLETDSEPYLNGIYTEDYTNLNEIKKYPNKFVIAIGGGLAGFLPLITLANNWFVRRRSIAIAAAGMGIYLGGVLVPVLAMGISMIGWRAISLGLGILFLFVVLEIVLEIRGNLNFMN